MPEDYTKVISELRIIHDAIDGWLKRCEAEIHKDMWEVSPGLWIGKQFKDFDECMKWLNELIA